MDVRPAPSLALQRSDARLAFSHGPGARTLSFKPGDAFPAWRDQARAKLAELLGLDLPDAPRSVRVLRTEQVGDITIDVVQMSVGENLALPAYHLRPRHLASPVPVMAIHGHGEAEACVGIRDDYHHGFAWFLARQGYAVLCPELRGFGVLKDVAADIPGAKLDYWTWNGHMAYSLVSEANLHGTPLIGQTVRDLLAWENWLCAQHAADSVHVAGISYGGDLALTYPPFSHRARSIFASGTLGSFSVIFSRCYNAPAHTIPSILRHLDRSDIAGLNAPTPLAIHFGELDVPGPKNFSASFNETVPPSLDELRAIYRAARAPSEPRLVVTPGKGHEMDNAQLLAFIRQHDAHHG